MKFIHTADLHLDSPFLGLKDLPDVLWQRIYESPLMAFKRLVSDAIDTQVDFVLITGDIYDRQERAINAQAAFLTEMERLNQAQIPVYLSYGNHDYLDAATDGLQLPANVHSFGEEISSFKLTTRDQTKVEIVGFSYPTRVVTTDMAATFPDRDPQADVQIGMLHGSIAGKPGPHDTDAPFTVDELMSKHYDYWALGHIHKRQVLHEERPWIIYPGNIQGRHINETGEKGYVLVQQEQSRLVPTFHAVAPVVWNRQTVDCASITATSDLQQTIAKQLSQLADRVKTHSTKQSLEMLNLKLIHTDQLAAETKQRLTNGSLLSLLQSQEMARLAEANQLVVDLQLADEDSESTHFTQLDQHYWNQAADSVFAAENIAKTADQLFAEPTIASALAHSGENLKQAVIRQVNAAGRNE
ncbi:MAG: DNA repair exonuclease [Furfurilactobacillus sp.]|jgi:DNA repair exonuclease SbcCD nuclease subunit|uniref:DNA repair exonuclease n=1 Tax=Furfurilactobacillus milii TaxID=2888272 RepID=A0ABT6D8T9_9LACO|nr:MULTISPECIES: DNA repair exonuclease [Furfurilactobacillus]QLE66763.1 DNA repair exonuclease protein YhaO [Furfurilactobacillus rossiae]MCF6160648.1 DNA repair exonuclease [Furfurilactobacillus milii]MCF6162880.1 DNA repair exonuclease [Furfurilactobacillus milii]MCF6420200.1 DNA repair exonuclease [Furfurilactobacillus milii]MCH4010470.1 DNA repair exonuclease [Furfurilactobacillus sp.]